MALKLPRPKLPAKIPNPDRPNVRIPSLRGSLPRVPEVVRRNMERYLGLALGYFLFVGPFAVFTWVAYALAGTGGDASIHSVCYRLPLDWLSGSAAANVGPMAAAFIVGVLIIALLFGPLFCGRLCPVGAVSEFVSRIVPLPERYRMRIRDTRVTASLRYGFLAGFIIMAWAAGGASIECSFGVEMGRYCSSSLLEYMSLGVFTGAVPANFWNTGAVLTMITWLVLGGVMMVGGRGWCLFFCPLGALSGLAHALGAKLGLYHIEFDEEKCMHCHKCYVSCPMWAIGLDRKVEPSLCMGCRECINNCSFKAYGGGFGRAGNRVSGAVKGLVSRIRSIGTFALASSTVPAALIVAAPCTSAGCAACPLGGACAAAMPIIFGGMMAYNRSAGRVKRSLSSLRSRISRLGRAKEKRRT